MNGEATPLFSAVYFPSSASRKSIIIVEGKKSVRRKEKEKKLKINNQANSNNHIQKAKERIAKYTGGKSSRV